MKRTPLKRKTGLRRQGVSDTAKQKRHLQALMRELVILRDGGCVLRHYPEAGECGGRKKDGELILQAEHLLTRSSSKFFADPRNCVCLCQRHHIFFKPQYSKLYWDLIKKHLGKKRWEWLQLAEADHHPHKVDWKLEEICLIQEIILWKKTNK